MNWFIIYYDMLLHTGIFGVLLLIISARIAGSLIVTIVGLIMKQQFRLWFIHQIVRSISLIVGIIVVMTIMNSMYNDMGKFKASIEIGYFILPLLLFILYSSNFYNEVGKDKKDRFIVKVISK